MFASDKGKNKLMNSRQGSRPFGTTNLPIFSSIIKRSTQQPPQKKETNSCQESQFFLSQRGIPPQLETVQGHVQPLCPILSPAAVAVDSPRRSSTVAPRSPRSRSPAPRQAPRQARSRRGRWGRPRRRRSHRSRRSRRERPCRRHQPCHHLGFGEQWHKMVGFAHGRWSMVYDQLMGM